MDESKMRFYKYLCSLPGVEEATDWWVHTRCVLCGDSRTSSSKMRLYICCNPNVPADGVGYICFNCNATGILTRDMLDAITSGADPEFSQTLRRINKRAALSSGGSSKTNKYVARKDVPPVIYPPLKAVDYQVNKYRYLVDRIGVKISPADFQQLKIVWSLRDFLQENGIPFNVDCKLPAPMLEHEFIGFGSTDNSYIAMRSIRPDVKKQHRFYKYKVFKELSEGIDSQYTIQNQINPVSSDPIRIIVAEGMFDIISILYNIYDGVQGNNVFTSCNNGAFENAIKTYFNKGLVGDNIEVHCYIDNDSTYDYKRLLNRIEHYMGGKKRFHIFHNTKNKDFGLPRSEIEVEELIP